MDQFLLAFIFVIVFILIVCGFWTLLLDIFKPWEVQQKVNKKSELDLGEIERLPEMKIISLVIPGISPEWDLFWLMPEDKKVTFFEFSMDYRKNKFRFEIESK